MDSANTQAAWQSRTNLLIVMGLLASIIQRHYGLAVPVEVQGLVVDLLPLAINGLLVAAIWFRVKARAVIDRWL